MPFYQITLETSQDKIEMCEDILNELGALSISLEDAKDQPLFEPKPNEIPLWNQTNIIALFKGNFNDRNSNEVNSNDVNSNEENEENFKIEDIKQSLKEQLPEKIFLTLHCELIQDQDWVRTSLDQFQPQYFGNKLWIVPSWIATQNLKLNNENDVKENDVVVQLDPGLAFGTGMHPTTRLCLEWLAKHPPGEQVVLDYGCGSGILGIAALKLGAKKLLAVDYDPQALTSTQSNTRLNHISDNQLRLFTPEEFNNEVEIIIKNENRQVDLILANILANPLIELTLLFNKVLKPKGQIVLSGILKEQQNEVIAAYQMWLKGIEVDVCEDWVCIQGWKQI